MLSPRIYISRNNPKCYTCTDDEDRHTKKTYFVLYGSMKLILIISLILSGIVQFPLQAVAQTKKTTITEQQAQTDKTSTSPQKPISQKKSPRRGPVFVPTKEPANGLSRVSGRRAGMGSRGNCPGVKLPLTALVPLIPQANANASKTSSIGIVGGLTTSERPEFLFYVPYTRQILNQSKAEFILEDSTGKSVYEDKQISLPSQAGVISVSLPKNTKPLKLDEIYRWYLKVPCDQETTSVPIYVDGEVKRVSLDSSITQQLEAADPKEKIEIYAREGIWFDALNGLAQMRKSSPQEDISLKKDWQILLRSVNLGNIDDAPLE